MMVVVVMPPRMFPFMVVMAVVRVVRTLPKHAIVMFAFLFHLGMELCIFCTELLVLSNDLFGICQVTRLAELIIFLVVPCCIRLERERTGRGQMITTTPPTKVIAQ